MALDYVGQSITRIDAENKVKGEALYPGDFNLPNQAYMKVLFAERPHAIVKSVDTSAAETFPGVIAVFTAKDVPVNEYGQYFQDQPVLCGPGSNKQYADRVRFVGDQIALVVAENEEIAAKARDLIRVEYEDLPVVDSVALSAKPDTILLHPDRGSNIISKFQIRYGDFEEAFKQADVIVEGTYDSPVQEHAYLQPEAGISYIDDEGRITVVVSGQWVHEEQKEIAHALGVPRDMVRVIYPAIGGAFGGREDISVQIILALAAMKLNERGTPRPVKIIWSREESIIGHAKRHAYTIHARWGATKDGKVIAAEHKIMADGGAYNYTSTSVLGNAVVMSTTPYEIPNVNVDGAAYYTNNIPGAAFRGFGGPQAAFAGEMQMNKLAEILNIDPVEIRLRNVLKEGSNIATGTPLPPGVTMDRVIEQCALKAGWEKTADGWSRKDKTHNEIPGKPYLKRGSGFACALKNVGFSFGFPEECWATIELFGEKSIKKAILYHAGTDVGQGAHTVFKQMAASALGISIDQVELVLQDTATSDNAGSTSASRMTLMAGNSIVGAARLALDAWNSEERPAIGKYQYTPPKTTPLDPVTGKSFPNFTYGYVAEFVEAEVDIETGQIHLTNVLCADDVGKAINPEQVRGQIEGCVVQAAGYSILENFVQQGGRPLTRTLSTYLIPTVLDIPDKVESMILEYPDPIGPWGARGMSEMPFLPMAPAIIQAVHDATGVWFDQFPLTPERVLMGIENKKK
jgi:CO/xanthine dehydrogenase Mo-binding subunit